MRGLGSTAACAAVRFITKPSSSGNDVNGLLPGPNREPRERDPSHRVIDVTRKTRSEEHGVVRA